jgi:hypothetical protein
MRRFIALAALVVALAFEWGFHAQSAVATPTPHLAKHPIGPCNGVPGPC